VQIHLEPAPANERLAVLAGHPIHNEPEVPIMINYQKQIGDLNKLKDDLFTANLPDESQLCADAIKTINHLLLSVEVEKQIVVSLSKTIRTLIMDVEAKAQLSLQAAKDARRMASALSDTVEHAKQKVVSLHDTKKGDAL
jgi:uncharacterized protein YgfB (UPF0149 family)